MKLLVCLLCFSVLPVFAGLSAGPGAWAEISEDQNRILVMLPNHVNPNREEEDEKKLPDGSTIKLREAFPVSGVYDLQTRQPLWTFDWGTQFQSSMAYTDDFSLMVVLHAENFKGKRWGLNFLKHGKFQKFYGVDELYTRFSEYYFLPYQTEGGAFERNGTILTFTTPRRGSPSPVGWRDIGYREIYTFDMKTGEILSLEIEDTKTKRIIAAVFVCFLLVFGLIIALLVWFLRRAKSKPYSLC